MGNKTVLCETVLFGGRGGSFENVDLEFAILFHPRDDSVSNGGQVHSAQKIIFCVFALRNVD